MNTLADTFELYLKGLKAAVAPTPSTPQPRFGFLAFIWHYLWGLQKRFAHLYAQWKAGTLPRRRGPRPGRAASSARAPAKFRFPSSRMWLIRDVQGVAFARSQLQHLIATTPEFHELLAAAPQLRRMLNPLCHMLGVDVDKPTGVPHKFTPAAPATAPAPAPAEPTPEPPQPNPRPRHAHAAPEGADSAPQAAPYFSSA